MEGEQVQVEGGQLEGRRTGGGREDRWREGGQVEGGQDGGKVVGGQVKGKRREDRMDRWKDRLMLDRQREGRWEEDGTSPLSSCRSATLWNLGPWYLVRMACCLVLLGTRVTQGTGGEQGLTW